MPKSPQKKLFVFVVLLTLALVTLLANNLVQQLRTPDSLDSERTTTSSGGSSDTLETTSTATTTANQDPFASMTIPYLRSRTYSSALGELKQLVEYTTHTSYLTSYDSDGLRINGLLTIPTGKPPEGGWPAVVFIHGYIPPTQYRTEERYGEYVSYLAQRGFVVFKIDLRGHGDSEGEATGAYYSGEYIIDTLNAYSALEASEFVNPNRIGLWGHSMAGNVVLRSLVAKPTIPAGVIWGGAVFTYEDFREFGISDASYQRPSTSTQRSRNRQLLFETHGEFEPNHPFWKTVVPTNYLEGVQGALQLHHAENDSVVAVEYATNLDTVLDGSAIEHEVFLYPTGGHNIEGGSFSQAMQRTVEFFWELLTINS